MRGQPLAENNDSNGKIFEGKNKHVSTALEEIMLF
jgi:hypothetical protein